MTTLRERADAMMVMFGLSYEERNVIERHLREACEDAVREAEDRARYKPTSEEIQEEIIREENRPTAEDALKAVAYLCLAIDPTGSKRDIRTVHIACMDFLAGQRDTSAAKAITGESAKNSNDKGGGK